MKFNIEIILIYNILRVIGWIQVIIFLVYQTSLELEDISTIANLVRWLIGAKMLEIIFIKPNDILNQRNIVKYYSYLTRILCLYYLMTPGLCFCSFRNTISGWAFQELFDSIYYVGKSDLTAQIKRILTYILIPYTALGMFRILNRVIEKNMDNLIFYRIIQIVLILQCNTSHVHHWLEQQQKEIIQTQFLEKYMIMHTILKFFLNGELEYYLSIKIFLNYFSYFFWNNFIRFIIQIFNLYTTFEEHEFLRENHSSHIFLVFVDRRLRESRIQDDVSIHFQIIFIMTSKFETLFIFVLLLFYLFYRFSLSAAQKNAEDQIELSNQLNVSICIRSGTMDFNKFPNQLSMLI
ncbi:unnamed protein product (macronuclear) [Paramecium tetraurelia]|uniref:Gustatory receptor n=1 Tax=Paramecium tetraurelia TaxID=5888 RepID=A0EBW7_PARTE|nr:uncharacterized protein GSPATT00025519001 [Paramecium tetraurelia]CAK92784.1 unnamed protein product [Paramecium tetraurelia]|eukprot:XP_001460181.1 hypothetical protein (macronuclear) [Paramecium tetraurelia strain d4-2]